MWLSMLSYKIVEEQLTQTAGRLGQFVVSNVSSSLGSLFSQSLYGHRSLMVLQDALCAAKSFWGPLQVHLLLVQLT